MTENNTPEFDYSFQDLDESNLRDLLPLVGGMGFVGIVSEKAGGIVAYAHQDNAATIVAALNGQPQEQEEEIEIPVLTLSVRLTDTISHETQWDSDDLRERIARAGTTFTDAEWLDVVTAPNPESELADILHNMDGSVDDFRKNAYQESGGFDIQITGR